MLIRKKFLVVCKSPELVEIPTLALQEWLFSLCYMIMRLSQQLIYFRKRGTFLNLLHDNPDAIIAGFNTKLLFSCLSFGQQ